MTRRDIFQLKKLGLQRYIDGMSIQYILPPIPITLDLSKSARQRLKWLDYHYKCRNVTKTCRYFGISSKTFYKWVKRYDSNNLLSLEEYSRRPKKTRDWQVTREEERRIKALRVKYIRYGKTKLRVIYRQIYNESISSWKIQRVIQKHKLYYSQIKNYKLQARKKRYQAKKCITGLIKQPKSGFLLALDTICFNIYGYRRYIFTAVDVYGKTAFARMYPGHGSAYAADFLRRLYYLLDGKIENIQTDNGSEFARYFRLAAEQLNLIHYHSRPHTPKDNPFDERFNRTLQDEFISLGHLTNDCDIFNKELTEWLIEYNFHRPHQSLNYLTPITFANQYLKVLPMCPSSTVPC